MTGPNLTKLERRVADVLHHHAEIAMSSTDTETQHRNFTAGIESSEHHRRAAWGIGAVAAAAAIVIALVLGGVAGPSSDKSDTQLPARGRTPVQIATDYVDALSAYDATKAARDVAVGDDKLRFWPGEASLREALAWAKAARFKISPKDCVSDRPVGGMTVVTCQFDWHHLGSDQLGWLPRGGEFSVRVRDGRIEGASPSMDWPVFGLRQDEHGDHPMWPPFRSWLEREHPDDLPAMILVGGSGAPSAAFQAPVYTDESLALWDRYVDDWVASQQ
jgi:hypothetical protein